MTQPTTTKATKWPYVIIGLLLAVIFFLSLQTCNNKKEQDKYTDTLIKALNDSLTTYKNKDSSNMARIAVIEMYNTTAFANLQVKDSEIVKLQTLVKKYEKQSKHVDAAVDIAGTTDYNNSTASDYLDEDSFFIRVRPSDTNYMYAIYPTYKTSSDNGWIKYDIIAGKDSTNLDIHIENTYSVVLGKDKEGNFAEVTNYNPYSTNKTVRAFKLITPKPKRWGIGVGTGVGINSSFKLRPQINAGIQYNFINF